MMNGRAVIHDWLSILAAVNEEMPQPVAILRKNSQHGFPGADDVLGCRAKATEKLLGMVLRAKFHSELDQRRKFQSCRVQGHFASFSGFVRVLKLEVFFLQFLFEALALGHIARGSKHPLKLAGLIVEGSRVIADHRFVTLL